MVNVLLIYTTLIPSVRFCALHMLNVLSDNKEINLVSKMSYKVTAADLNECDLLVMVRCCENNELEIAEKCKKAGRKIIFVLDDDLLNVPDSVVGCEYFQADRHKKNLREIMKLSDVLWSPNPNLIKKYGFFFDKSVLIDEPYAGYVKLKSEDNDKIHMGYAGTETHKNFVDEFLGDVLKTIKSIYKDQIHIEFFGFKPNFLNEVNGTYIPYCDNYKRYCEIMRERNWDIGLAPLENSEFDSCKYFNKYIEYSSYGIAGVYSKVEPYTFGIKNGVNGVLAENSAENWVNAISKLIEDKKLRKQIIEFAQAELQTKFNAVTIADKIFDKEIFVKCSSNTIIKHRKKFFVIEKLKMYIRVYGIFMPVVSAKKLLKKIIGYVCEIN